MKEFKKKGREGKENKWLKGRLFCFVHVFFYYPGVYTVLPFCPVLCYPAVCIALFCPTFYYRDAYVLPSCHTAILSCCMYCPFLSYFLLSWCICTALLSYYNTILLYSLCFYPGIMLSCFLHYPFVLLFCYLDVSNVFSSCLRYYGTVAGDLFYILSVIPCFYLNSRAVLLVKQSFSTVYPTLHKSPALLLL
jgi:hypothetical protein